MNNEIITRIAKLLNIKENQVLSVLSLTEDGCTIPFISRYRKEKTGNLDEIIISSIIENHRKITEIEKRREYILNYLKENDKLTPDLKKKLTEASTLTELEDLYLPYKPRKKTLADKARDLGLEPMAQQIKEKNLSQKEALEIAKQYISKDVPDAEKALAHALNIVIQDISDSSEVRGYVREKLGKGSLHCSVKRGKKEEGQKYKDYFDFNENMQSMPSHRIMAILRGAQEGFLNMQVEPQDKIEHLQQTIAAKAFNKKGELLIHAAGESLNRHLLKSLGNEVLSEIRERAEKDSLDIFSKNLEKILLASPFGEKPVIGIDPGIRTGCKAVIIDKNGDFKEYINLQLHERPGEIQKIEKWIKDYTVKGIAIGDGTFGRETYSIVKQYIQKKDIIVALVDEDGASVYSAGNTAREEFPDLDVTVKGAISIARRFQDPLAELVKIEPKSLGIGQYQHDVTPSLLKEKLNQTIEWAVNKVGVNANTAGYHLLSYVSGLDKGKAKEFVKYRSSQNGIVSITDIKKIKGIGDKAFQQCAGFLRIHNGKNILDSTGLHPESYKDVKKIAEFYKVSTAELIEKPEIVKEKEIRKSLNIDELISVLSELHNRGLDPRQEFSVTQFSDNITSIDDLHEGLILNGVVDNVVAFGAFIDIGIKEKGLVHISEVSNDFIENITSALSVGDQVKVKILSIDTDRSRISLSIKQALQTIH